MQGYYNLRMDRCPNSKGEYPVYLNYSTMGVPVKKSTGITVNPDHWMGKDGKNGKFIKTGKDGHPKAEQLNRRLVNFKSDFDKTIDELTATPNTKLTVEMLQSILNGSYKEKKEQAAGKMPFIQYVLDVNGKLYERGKISYSVWNNIQCSMNRFKKYLQEKHKMETNQGNVLYCRDLKAEIIEGYISWRQGQANSPETINKALTPIFKAVKKIGGLGWISQSLCEEILEMYLPTNQKSLADTDEEKHFLTEEQVRQFIQIAANSKYSRTKDFADMFLFSLHTGGLRFSDICTLRWSEIDMESRTINHLQVKNHTKKPTYLTLPITDEGLKILQKWEGRYGNFVFGMLPDEFDLADEKALKQLLNSQNRTINQSLRSIGLKMGLPYNLHFHCSRHTWATLALNRNVDLNIISALMGHSSSWITGKVYAKYLPKTIAAEVNEKLNFNFNNY